MSSTQQNPLAQAGQFLQQCRNAVMQNPLAQQLDSSFKNWQHQQQRRVRAMSKRCELAHQHAPSCGCRSPGTGVHANAATRMSVPNGRSERRAPSVIVPPRAGAFAAIIPGDSVAEAVLATGFLNFLNLYNSALIVRLVLTWFPNPPAFIEQPLS